MSFIVYSHSPKYCLLALNKDRHTRFHNRQQKQNISIVSSQAEQCNTSLRRVFSLALYTDKINRPRWVYRPPDVLTVSHCDTRLQLSLCVTHCSQLKCLECLTAESINTLILPASTDARMFFLKAS